MKHAILGLALFACATPPATSASGPNNPGAFTEPAAASPVRGWVVLARGPADPAAVSRTYEITEPSAVAQIMVKSIEGSPEIEQIQIEYVDDSQPQVVRLERPLSQGDGQVIELRHKKQISKLVVVTDPDSTGEYIVFGG
jgi:hypothetical protein